MNVVREPNKCALLHELVCIVLVGLVAAIHILWNAVRWWLSFQRMFNKTNLFRLDIAQLPVVR